MNNAGVAMAGPLEILPLEALRRQFEVNVVGLVAVTQVMLPLLRKARGRIVNVSSINGWTSAPYLGPYAASKHAVEALSDSLRMELRSWGIQVAVVQPGSTNTPIWKKSLAAANALAEQISTEAVDLYRADLDLFRQATAALESGGRTVEDTVRAVLHALTARRPKTRYRVGLQVDLLFRAWKWVPDRLWDRLVQWALGLP